MQQKNWLTIAFLLVAGCKEPPVCGDGENDPATLCFDGKGSFAAGLRPFSVAIGDVNRDGLVDLVSADRDANTVTVLLGQADGVFAKQTPIPVQLQPFSVALADFNGDGALDIAAASAGLEADPNPDPVSVMLNNGSGGFGAPVENPVGDRPVSLIAADFTGDGKADIVAANNIGDATNTFSTLTNNGNGTFAPQVFSGGSASPAGIAAGDLDGDGDLDIAIANAPINQVGIMLNEISEGGSISLRNSVPVGSLPTSMTIFDTDNDGDNDIVVTQVGDGNMVVISNDGPNVFNVRSPIATGQKPQSVTAGDFNGDSFTDLAVVNQDLNQVVIFVNNKAGDFVRDEAFLVGGAPVFVAAFDINKDGISDFVTANEQTNNVSVTLSIP